MARRRKESPRCDSHTPSALRESRGFHHWRKWLGSGASLGWPDDPNNGVLLARNTFVLEKHTSDFLEAGRKKQPDIGREGGKTCRGKTRRRDRLPRTTKGTRSCGRNCLLNLFVERPTAALKTRWNRLKNKANPCTRECLFCSENCWRSPSSFGYNQPVALCLPSSGASEYMQSPRRF